MSSSTADRESWTAYAQREGLVTRLDEPPVSVPPKRTKYGSVKVQVGSQVFDSKKEARIYQELKACQAAGQIKDLCLQTAWPLHIMQLWRRGQIQLTQVGVYHSDFDYIDLRTGEWKVIDVKSPATRRKESYRLKKKIVEAVHGITIDEL